MNKKNKFLDRCRQNDLKVGIDTFNVVDVGYRGGTLGMYSENLIKEFIAPIIGLDYDEIAEIHSWLPTKIGCYCNYLGGGIRGSVSKSDYDVLIGEKYPEVKELIDGYLDLCLEFYEKIEEDANLNDEDYDDDINWDAVATNNVRKAGIKSAY